MVNILTTLSESSLSYYCSSSLPIFARHDISFPVPTMYKVVNKTKARPAYQALKAIMVKKHWNALEVFRVRMDNYTGDNCYLIIMTHARVENPVSADIHLVIKNRELPIIQLTTENDAVCISQVVLVFQLLHLQ